MRRRQFIATTAALLGSVAGARRVAATVPPCPPAWEGQAAVSCGPLPQWAPSSAGQVIAIPGTNTITDMKPSPTPPGSHRYHIDAWNGGFLVRIDGSPHLGTWGGGHTDYAGNEIYLFGPLNSDVPVWQRFDGPTNNSIISAEPGAGSTGYYSDGRAGVGHTRGTMAVLGDKLWAFAQNAVYPGGQYGYHQITMAFDFSAGAWDPYGSHPDVPGGGRGVAVADPDHNKIWWKGDGSSPLCCFNIDSNSWTSYGPNVVTDIEGNGCLDTKRYRLYTWTKYSTGQQLIWDLSNPSAPPISSGFSGTPPGPKCGVEYDADRDRVVALDEPGSDQHVIRELNPDSLAWSSRTFTGTAPTGYSGDYQGHFGRFRYVSELRGYVFVSNVSQPVSFFRAT